MYRLSTVNDIPMMKRLWDSSFHDPVNYIDFIFDRVATQRDVAVCELDDKIVAMVTMLPTKFVYKGVETDARYYLGAATAKKYQSRGIMSELLSFADAECAQRGAKLVTLVPSAAYLFKFYKNRGYSSDFNVRYIDLRPGSIRSDKSDVEIRFDKITASEVARIREYDLRDIAHIKWDEKQIKFIMDDSLIYNDHIASYEDEEGVKSYAFYSVWRKSGLVIREIMGVDIESKMALLKGLAETLGAKKMELTLPIQSELFYKEGETIHYGMSKILHMDAKLSHMDPYMGMMLD